MEQVSKVSTSLKGKSIKGSTCIKGNTSIKGYINIKGSTSMHTY